MLTAAPSVSGQVDLLEGGAAGLSEDVWTTVNLQLHESGVLQSVDGDDCELVLGNVRQCVRFENASLVHRQWVLRLQWKDGTCLFINPHTSEDMRMWCDAFESTRGSADDTIRSFVSILKYYVTLTAGDTIGRTDVFAASAFHADSARRT
jgi:hypothetical protein